MTDVREPRGILPYSPENYPPEVPDFETEEECRDFWDTHDFSYYADQFEDVTDSPPPWLEEGPAPEEAAKRNLPRRETTRFVPIRLSTDELAAVRALAERRRITHHGMLRTWILERLAQERAFAETPERKAS